MLTLAHFTAEELPGTLAIFLSGACLALAIVLRSAIARWAYLSFFPLLLIAVVAAGADHDPLFASAAGLVGGKKATDCLWLAIAALVAILCAVLGRNARASVRD